MGKWSQLCSSPYLKTLENVHFKKFSKTAQTETILVCSGSHNKVSQTRGLKQHKFISTVLRAGSLRPRCRRGGFCWRPSPWFAAGCLLPASPHPLFSAHICVMICASVKDTRHIGIGPTVVTSFQLNYLFKDLVSKCSHILRFWSLGLQHVNLGEHDSAHNFPPSCLVEKEAWPMLTSSQTSKNLPLCWSECELPKPLWKRTQQFCDIGHTHILWSSNSPTKGSPSHVPQETFGKWFTRTVIHKKEYMCVYVCVWTTLLPSRNQHNIANQLYFN